MLLIAASLTVMVNTYKSQITGAVLQASDNRAQKEAGIFYSITETLLEKLLQNNSFDYFDFYYCTVILFYLTDCW